MKVRDRKGSNLDTNWQFCTEPHSCQCEKSGKAVRESMDVLTGEDKKMLILCSLVDKVRIYVPNVGWL